MQILLIPTHQRPAFLARTLQYLREAGARDHLVVFALDRGADPTTRLIARAYEGPKIVLPPASHPYQKGSCNILEGLREARAIADRIGVGRIHILEDDIFVAPDYLQWHRLADDLYRPMIASACRNQNTRMVPPDDPEGAYYHPSYQSLGVSLSLEMVDLILPHAVPEFYGDPIGYCDRHFPDTALPITYAEQAGLIRRIVERYGLRTLYAAVPRAYHAGFVGTNRPGSELTGSFAEQVRELSGMSGEEMNRRAGIFEDITPCDMTPREIDRIRIVSLQSDCIAEAL